MRLIRVALSGVVVAIAIATCFAGTAAAKAPVLHLKYGGSTELTSGPEVEGFDYDWKLSTSGEGSADCTYKEQREGLTGKDETNNAATDVIGVRHAEGAFFNEFKCSSSIPGVEPEARGSVFTENSNPALVDGEFKLRVKGKAEYVSAAKGDTILALYNPSNEGCYYEIKKLKGTLSNVPTNLEANFSGQKLKLIKELDDGGPKSLTTCPKAVALTTTFSFYVLSGGEHPLEGEIL